MRVWKKSGMNLHIFPYDSKLFVPKFVVTMINGTHAQNNLLMCYVRKMVVLSLEIPFATPELVLSSIKHKSVNRIIFHGLQPEAISLIKILKKEAPECRIEWIYWGENYDDLAWILGNRTLNEYLKDRGFPSWLSFLMIKTKFANALLRARNARFRHITSKYAQCIDTMYHWSRPDYEHVKMLLKCRRMKFKYFFYDIGNVKTLSSKLVEQELKCKPAECLILGHSAIMRNNHLDVLPAICEFAVKRNKVVVVPLSYSTERKNYVERIAKYLREKPGLSFRICYKFYQQSDYLSFLSQCGAYIAPGCGSIGAGNMIAYALSGRVPVTNHRNSTGTFLKSLGAKVAIYQNNNDLFSLLDNVFGNRCQKNRDIVGEYFSHKNQSKYYEDLLSVV